MMTYKEELTKEVGRSITRPIAFIQLFFLLALFTTPFIWIWVSFHLAGKVALSAIIGLLITKFMNYVVKEVFKEMVEEELKKQDEKKIGGSTFQKKLREMIKQNEENKNE